MYIRQWLLSTPGKGGGVRGKSVATVGWTDEFRRQSHVVLQYMLLRLSAALEGIFGCVLFLGSEVCSPYFWIACAELVERGGELVRTKSAVFELRSRLNELGLCALAGWAVEQI